MFSYLTPLIRKHRYVQALEKELHTRRKSQPATFVPAGHFYSPVVDPQDLASREEQVWPPPPSSLPGIDLRANEQKELLRTLWQAYPNFPWPAEPGATHRYGYLNPNFGVGDAQILRAMLRYCQPQRVIEVGSGYSSALMMDVWEQEMARSFRLTCIEPYPDLLQQLLRPDDPVEVLAQPVQSVDLSRFEALTAGDILFIDSSHVSKTGSDVNWLLFEVLPRLQPGVFVHFHDMFYPFEYIKPWVLHDARSWNEAYLIRAFLTHNDAYELRLFNHFLYLFEGDALDAAWPDFRKSLVGSIWLEKVQRSSHGIQQ